MPAYYCSYLYAKAIFISKNIFENENPRILGENLLNFIITLFKFKTLAPN